MCPYNECIIYICIPVSWFPSHQVYGLLLRGFHIEDGCNQSEGRSHSDIVSLVTKGATVEKM
jgi:hypothetical protein